MYAKITKDLLYDGEGISHSHVGTIPVSNGIISGELLQVRLLDDDGEHYYTAEADDEALEPLFEWAMRDSGVTLLQVRKDGKWVDTIA